MTEIKEKVLIEEFAIFGVHLNNVAVLDKLCHLCRCHGLDEESIVTQWLAYSNTKKINGQLSTENLDHFEREQLNKIASKTRTRPASEVTFSDETIDETLDIYNSGNDDLVNKYCTPKNGSKKRRLPSETGSSKRILLPNRSPGLSLSPSLSSPTTTLSEKYKSRTNAGIAAVTFGPVAETVWERAEKRKLMISNHDTNANFKDCKYMFEKLYEKANVLSNQIDNMAQDFKDCQLVEEFLPVSLPHQGTVTIAGRIGCDGNGRLNSSSVILQGSKKVSSGLRISLDLSSAPQYSLFPGQVVAVEGSNATGSKFVVSKVYEGIELPLSTKPVLAKGDLRIVVACGPFTVSDNYLYEPLDDLLCYLEKHPPDVCLLLGPFVDAKMAESEGLESTNLTFEEIFHKIMIQIIQRTQKLGVALIVLPSQRDIHHDCVYPQPPFTFPKSWESKDIHLLKDIHFVPDPCTLDIDGLILGATSTDSLFHLGAEEISNACQTDRVARLANHVLTQHCYYPLYPSGPDVNIDTELNDLYGQLTVTPHLLLLPSDLRTFVKNVGKAMCVNPGRLTKGQIGGTFARIVIRQPQTEGPLSDSIAAEILRI